MRTALHYPETKSGRFSDLAANYLKNSGKEKYYLAYYTMRDEVSDIEGIGFYVKIADEQIDEIKAAIAEAKAEEIDLAEYWNFEIPEYLQQDNSVYGQWYDIETVNFDEVYVRIDARVAFFPSGIDSAHKVFKSAFYLSEEEYIELLTWQMTNRYGQFNDLIVSHPELYAVINGCIRGVWGEFDIISPVATPIFAVELTGIQRDAKIVLGDQPISNITWEQNEQNNHQNCVLAIEENILTFFYQCSADGTVRSKHLNNVDALAVEKMLGVDSYQAIAEWITANAKGKEGVDMFQNMLDKNGIAYGIEENCYNI